MFITIFFTVLSAIPTFSITGGERAKPGEFPFQVQLYYKHRFFCAGTILSPFTVATAAHCFYPEGKLLDRGEITVVGGSLKRLDYFIFDRINEEIQVRKVSSYFKHPEYNKTMFGNDLGIIVVDKPFIFNQNVGRIQLPKSNENFEHSNATVIGHGGSNISMSTTHLLKLDLPFGNGSNCDGVLEVDTQGEVRKDHCILVEAGIGSCKGDSGGPLICYRNNENGSNPVLCGIVSRGMSSNHSDFKCGKMDIEIFTKVESFLEWIKWSVTTVEARKRCDREHFFCFSNEKCIERKFICNQVNDCPDGEDELECLNYKACGSSEFRCSNGNCLEETDLCDLTFDCGGVYNNNTYVSTSDEEKCPKDRNETCKLEWHDCGLNDRCIKMELKCDGIPDCKNLSDEKDCGEEDVSTISFSTIFEGINGNLLLWVKIAAVMLIFNFGIGVILLVKLFMIFLKPTFFKRSVIPLKWKPTFEEEGL